jgi:hypothetical protein
MTRTKQSRIAGLGRLAAGAVVAAGLLVAAGPDAMADSWKRHNGYGQWHGEQWHHGHGKPWKHRHKHHHHGGYHYYQPHRPQVVYVQPQPVYYYPAPVYRRPQVNIVFPLDFD